MLDYEIWGNSVQTWIVSLLIIAGAFIVVKLLSLLGRKVKNPLSAAQATGWTTSYTIPWNRP